MLLTRQEVTGTFKFHPNLQVEGAAATAADACCYLGVKLALREVWAFVFASLHDVQDRNPDAA